MVSLILPWIDVKDCLVVHMISATSDCLCLWFGRLERDILCELREVLCMCVMYQKQSASIIAAKGSHVLLNSVHVFNITPTLLTRVGLGV